MPDIRPVTDTFAVAPQLAPEDLGTVVALGYRSLVNNRPDGEAAEQPSGAQMREAATAAGLAYQEIPVRGRPTRDQIEEMRRAVAAGPSPVLAFCRSGTRSVTIWALGAPDGRTRTELIALAAEAGYDLEGVLPRDQGAM